MTYTKALGATCAGLLLVSACAQGESELATSSNALTANPPSGSNYLESEPPPLPEERTAILRGAASGPALQGTELIVNGGFESGGFDGWTIFTSDGGTSGNWVIFDEFFQPLSGIPPTPPFDGTFGAITDMIGPGERYLFQDVTLGNGPAVLRFADKLDNLAGIYEPGVQEYRVDIVEPGSPGEEPVLATLFSTEPEDPTMTPFTLREFDLSAFANQTIRIRFTEIDNLFFFNTAVDSVSLIQDQSSQNLNCRVALNWQPNPVTPGDPFTLRMNFNNRGDGFTGSFAVFVIANGDIVPIGEETTAVNRAFGVRRFPIFATLSLEQPAPSVGFLVTVTDTSSGALVCSDVTVVAFGDVEIAAAARNEIMQAAASFTAN